jgi:hypothetical protein
MWTQDLDFQEEGVYISTDKKEPANASCSLHPYRKYLFRNQTVPKGR